MYKNYELRMEEKLADISSYGTFLVHKKTGARVLLVSNDDNNKVFSIAFRTPPVDSTGAAHIVEHTVLCGSRKFPVKDPFVELAKGSLNTFLNAMTFPDKTMYPVASCNDKDFRNLCDVYLDAVFYPNIYKDERIFAQEGWHYHLENADDNLNYNGVVYNEMKGAFSTPDSVLERSVFNALFPDTPYGLESGGDPSVIPTLTYEEFLAFHKRYYHPSNSYIYLYGNMDMEETLKWIDEEYLSRFDRQEIDSKIMLQKPFAAMKDMQLEYPVLDDEPVEGNTYFDASFVIENGADVMKSVAMNVLEYALLDAPGAPIGQALLDAGVGKTVSGCYNDGILQPFFSIDVKYADDNDFGRFKDVIRETLRKLVKDGIDKKSLEAAVHYFEFRFRESDYASYPKGLIYGMNIFDSWLYDDERPFDYLKQTGVFDELKKRIGTGYYEELIEKELLNNSFGAYTKLSPVRGLAAKKEAETAEILQKQKEEFSTEEIESIVKKTAELKAFQESSDSKEALATIPMLKRSDIDRKTPFIISNIFEKIGETTVVRHDFDTNGITYLTLLFELGDFADEYASEISLLKSVLGNIGTEKFGYYELSNEINARTGGIIFGTEAFPKKDGSFRRFFGIKAKFLKGETAFAFDMIKEIITNSKLDDTKRLYEIVAMQKAYYQDYLASAGHVAAIGRAASGLSKYGKWEEKTNGIEYYHYLEGLYKDFDSRKDELAEVFGKLTETMFRTENMLVEVTAGEDAAEKVKECVRQLKRSLVTPAKGGYPAGESRICSLVTPAMGGCLSGESRICPLATPARGGCPAGAGGVNTEESLLTRKSRTKEAFKTSGQVQYVGICGDYIKHGFDYTGTMRVLKTILNYDYLWLNLRMKGGAYGCMSFFRRYGICALVSYRDPHLKNTLDVYAGLSDYLKTFDADDEEMTKYVIGTISELDTPMGAKAKGALSFNAYMQGLTIEELQKERDEILDVTKDDIRRLSDLASKVLNASSLCVIGSEAAINKHKELFESVRPLVNA